MLVPASRLDRVVSRLEDDGYDEGPEPSAEFSVSEGARLELCFHGNVRRDDEQRSTPLVFHYRGEVESRFQVAPVDRFLQSQLEWYRGVVDVYRIAEDSTKEVNSAGGQPKCTRQLVASHHVYIPKTVGPQEWQHNTGADQEFGKGVRQ